MPSTAFTIDEQKMIITYAHMSKAKNEILLALYTGMRVGEIVSLYVSDIDFKNRTISVNKSQVDYKDFDAKPGHMIKKRYHPLKLIHPLG